MTIVDRIQIRRALIDFVYESAGLEPVYRAGFDLTPYYLSPGTKPSHKPLSHILSLIGSPNTAVTLPPMLMTNVASWVHRHTSESPLAFLESWRELDPASAYETWVSVTRRAASTLPARSGEAGVSLYHEFKVLSAVVHAALINPDGQDDGYTLVSGDFPGVQRMIYTVTSDGATKGVRGRSFFLQLLADCVVRRFLDELGDLPITNALIVAGGNFLLLTPSLIDGISASDRVANITAEINRQMLDLFEGDLSLVTGTEPLSHTDITDKHKFGAVLRQLKMQEGRSKKQPLRDVALSSEENWAVVFDAHGQGGQEVCIVCQREPRDKEEREAFQNKQPCRTCRLFEGLAQDLAKTPTPFLIFETNLTHPDRLRRSYARALYDITQWACTVTDHIPEETASGRIVLQLNQIDFTSDEADGFRLLAVHTPLVSKPDKEWMVEYYGNNIPDDRERWPRSHEDIRDFEMLASAHAIRHYSQTGQCIPPTLARLGVLRMDVDNLGMLFSRDLQNASLTTYLAVSDALSFFFDGYLGPLCRQFEEENNRPNSLYLLYGGGDDLFIVGEWDLLPYLAQRIHDEFRAYAASSGFSISAGIILVPLKFPFYRAADLAHEALESAKDYQRPNGMPKDAISFLGAVLPWKSDEAWHIVVKEHERLREVADKLKRNAVIRHVQHIYERWWRDRQLRNEPEIYFGPYMWLAAYQMSRLAEHHTAVRQDIDHIQKFLLQPETISLSGPAARWAELERRANQAVYEEGEDE